MKKSIFLHGFYASGSCSMATTIKEVLKEDVEIMTPDLPLRPTEALAFVREMCFYEHPDCLIGNSNGAFLAQMIATELKIPALLGNPHMKMSEFVGSRLGENRYKSARIDGKQEFVIDTTLVEEFAYLERHQWDNWNSGMRNLCVGLFGEKDTLACFESDIRDHYDEIYYFPGNHTPTVEEVREWYVPRVTQILSGSNSYSELIVERSATIIN